MLIQMRREENREVETESIHTHEHAGTMADKCGEGGQTHTTL